MKCPVCRATYRVPEKVENSNSASAYLCRRCGVDLAPLIHLHDLAIWHHHQAIQALQAGNLQEAMQSNERALALYSNCADFYALAGQILALQGEFVPAIGAWQKALQIAPEHPNASKFFQFFAQILPASTQSFYWSLD
ncbi:hypothetical protein [Pseudanabaena sp. PCC 6802]|uniref:hypothetical protein n=1 Tax=Pseudanabaena sp. PCC 6802 TaxID=118173 RepID=UPI00034DDD4E|nr:hypothetical protein [Pseudanabaena sp. PCC 6802]